MKLFNKYSFLCLIILACFSEVSYAQCEQEKSGVKIAETIRKTFQEQSRKKTLIDPQTKKELLNNFNYQSSEDVMLIPGPKLDFLSEEGWDQIFKNTDVSSLTEYRLPLRTKKTKNKRVVHFAPIMYSSDKRKAIAVVQAVNVNGYSTVAMFLQSVNCKWKILGSKTIAMGDFRF